MAYFSVSYDLNEKKNYDRLTSELERLGGVRIQRSHWLISLNNDTLDVKNHLTGFIDDDDWLAVIRFTERPRLTRGYKSGINWVKKHFG